jgi:hypothetical protein
MEVMTLLTAIPFFLSSGLMAHRSFPCHPLPRATFRSSNATGSDEALSSSVSEVDPTRLHIVTPSPNH